MRVRSVAVAAAALAGSVALGAPAHAVVCDAYSRGCAEPPRVLPVQQGRSLPSTDIATGPATATRTQAESPSSLPFTGGDVLVLSTVAVGALAAGTAMVVAGRRRHA